MKLRNLVEGNPRGLVLTQPQIDIIVGLGRQGYRVSQIKRATGHNAQTITRYLDEYNIPRTVGKGIRGRRTWDDETEKQLIDLYNADYSRPQIADELNTTTNRVAAKIQQLQAKGVLEPRYRLNKLPDPPKFNSE